jgi:hypothetical protein
MTIAGIAITIKYKATAIVICAILIAFCIRTGGFWQIYYLKRRAMPKHLMKNYWKGDFSLNIVPIKYPIKKAILITIATITVIWPSVN